MAQLTGKNAYSGCKENQEEGKEFDLEKYLAEACLDEARQVYYQQQHEEVYEVTYLKEES